MLLSEQTQTEKKKKKKIYIYIYRVHFSVLLYGLIAFCVSLVAFRNFGESKVVDPRWPPFRNHDLIPS